MNIREKIERIEALEAECYERLKSLKAEAQQEQEFPQGGDEYWYVSATGRALITEWEGYGVEKDALEIGNVFKTEEEADFAVEKLKVEAELRKFSKPFELDSYNYYIFLDTGTECLDVGSRSYCQSQGTIHFESEEKVQQAVSTVGEERIKKYIFGVED